MGGVGEKTFKNEKEATVVVFSFSEESEHIPGSVTGSSCCVPSGRLQLKSKVSSYLLVKKPSVSRLCAAAA